MTFRSCICKRSAYEWGEKNIGSKWVLFRANRISIALASTSTFHLGLARVKIQITEVITTSENENEVHRSKTVWRDVLFLDFNVFGWSLESLCIVCHTTRWTTHEVNTKHRIIEIRSLKWRHGDESVAWSTPTVRKHVRSLSYSYMSWSWVMQSCTKVDVG